MAISTAVGSELISNIVGYALAKGFFQEDTPNLPQRIVILGEANTANQATLDLTGKEITSAKEAAEDYGFGSPIHQVMRILRPPTGGGIGGIPTIVMPQLSDVGAVAESLTVTPTGTADGNATHTLVVNGRDNIDGTFYDYTVVEGDTPTDIVDKQVLALAGVLGSPVTGVNNTAVLEVTAKWEGLTSQEIDIRVDTKGNPVGVTYVVAAGTSGAGTVDISGALAQFQNEWNTLIINTYGVDQFTTLEAFNGVPAEIPTGRYAAITFKPFISLWGSKEFDKDKYIVITDAAARKDQVTHALCPAPNSEGFSWEAAANGGLLAGRIMQDTPHLDVQGKSYPDMPGPIDGIIGDMSDYVIRDLLVKKGCSTVDFINNKYVFQDFVTTYHPDGETPPQFRYPRNLMIDFNVKFGYFILQGIHVENHSIAESDQAVNVPKVIKPKQWVQIVNGYSESLALRNLIVDVEFMQKSIEVGTSGTNPDRLETAFDYKRSPYVRIVSTTGRAGFAFGVN